jgi:hypothetical protein
MRQFALLLFVGLVGCSAASKQKQDEQLLIAKDKSCAAHTDQASCSADTTDGCQWLDVVAPVACAPGSNCPDPPSSGVCQGQADGDQCVIADQCGRQMDQASCLAHTDCGWVPGVCAEPAGGPDQSADGGTTYTCPAFVCQPVNPCDGLDQKTCAANPECMLQDEEACTGSAPCPAYACPADEPNCAPPPGYSCPDLGPPTCTSSLVCVHAPVVCEGGGGGGINGGSPTSGPPTASGGATSNN